jgi:hypothetical protein
LLRTSAIYATQLRRELSERNQQYAKQHGLPHVLSYGGQPVVCYEPAGVLHGNFHPAVHETIRANPDWVRRLTKAHTSKGTSLPRNERGFWGEMDSCNSSDALLMNIFCFPGVVDSVAVQNLLGLSGADPLQFGWKARVPLKERKFDRTEVDMLLGDLMIEAKLTEASFQSAGKEKMRRYRAFMKVFAISELPQSKTSFDCYQLLRNVLAAFANNYSFCVLLDQRRPDLIEMWYAVMRAVKVHELRLRCKVLTYQELSEVLPGELQWFLAEKYGI